MEENQASIEYLENYSENATPGCVNLEILLKKLIILCTLLYI
jgi:hypothetical protein